MVIASIVALIAMVAAAIAPIFRYDPSAHTGEYSFIDTRNGQPVRWNPCAPIHYVVNLTDAPPGSLADVKAAVATISAASGIQFVYDGISDEVPLPLRKPYQPDRYPARWAPVLIGWVDPTSGGFSFKKDDQGHEAIGIGGPIWLSGGPLQYVSGFVVINDEGGYPAGFGSPFVQGSTILHELGHVLGLGHVKQQGELMEFSGGGMATFGPGDLQGLKQVGRPAGCLVTPPVP
ncbi:MAG: hypothetical protein QOE83_2505 [Actinomycetota bacterium]|nr:hypothetical protein [Actinomycetota bacterium]